MPEDVEPPPLLVPPPKPLAEDAPTIDEEELTGLLSDGVTLVVPPEGDTGGVTSRDTGGNAGGSTITGGVRGGGTGT